MKETRNITETSLKWKKLEISRSPHSNERNKKYNGVLTQMKETRTITESSIKWKKLEI